MGTSALRSHLKINCLGSDPGSTCLVLSLDGTGAVHVHGTFCKVLEVDEADNQFFLQLHLTGLVQAKRSPLWCCWAGTHKGHSDGCSEDTGKIMHGQSHSFPFRHTWTSARFAAWFPESLGPRVGHRGDGTSYLICPQGMNHLKPTFSYSPCCFLPPASEGPGSLQLKNQGRKLMVGEAHPGCDYYRCPGHSQLSLEPFAQQIVTRIMHLLTWLCNTFTHKDK